MKNLKIIIVIFSSVLQFASCKSSFVAIKNKELYDEKNIANTNEINGFKAVDIFNGIAARKIKDIFSIKPASNNMGIGLYVKLD